MKQKELAQRLNKSLACISKYEKGDVAVDILTVYEIAKALSVSPRTLLPEEDKSLQNDLMLEQLPSIFRQQYVYLYIYAGERHTVVPCCMEIQHDSAHVILYIELQDARDYKNCKYLMTGVISCCETNVVINAVNPLLNGDLLLLCFSRVTLLQEQNIGLCTTVTPTYRFRATKCYLQTIPVSDPEVVKERLLFTKDELAFIRKNHSLLV